MMYQKIGEPVTIPYLGEIRGYGEVWEMASVEHLRRKLAKIHPLNSYLVVVPVGNNNDALRLCRCSSLEMQSSNRRK